MNSRILCLVLILCLLPSFFLTYLNYIDPFLLGPVSNAAAGVRSDEMMLTGSGQDAYDVLLFSVSAIAGIDAIEVACLPIGIVVVLTCFYALASRMTGSRTISALLCVYIAFDFSLYPGFYSVLAYAWTLPLFFCYVLAYQVRLLRPALLWRGLLVMYVYFFAIYFIHPTYTFWTLIFTGAMTLYLYGEGRLCKCRIHLRTSAAFALSLAVIYLVFNKVFYDAFLVSVLSESSSIYSEFSSTILSFLGMEPHLDVPFMLATSPPSAVIGYAAFVRTVVVLGVSLLGLMVFLKNVRRAPHQDGHVDSHASVATSLFTVGIGHTAGYAIYGRMSLRFAVLLYPLTCIMMLQRSHSFQRIQIGFVSVLAILAVAQTVSFIIEQPYQDSAISSEIRGCSDWMLSSMERNSAVLSDFHTSQWLLYSFSVEHENFTQYLYDSVIFGGLVSSDTNATREVLRDVGYVVVNRDSETTPSGGWRIYEALSPYYAIMDDNTCLDMLYDDGAYFILGITPD